MSFEYHEETLELKIKDQVYPFRSPSAYDQKELSKKFKEATDDMQAVDLYIEFFVGLGLPKEVLAKLSMKGLLGLFEYAVGAKKN
jgi:hypothetical protein